MQPILVTLLAAAGLAAAQKGADGVYTIANIQDISQDTRDYWCQQQESQCPLICLQQPGVTSQDTIKNDCDAESLTFSCVCEDNKSPNLTQYSQTLPYYLCTEYGTQCSNACGRGNDQCVSDCRANNPCGAQEPKKPNATASSTSASATASKSSEEEDASATGLLGASTTAAAQGLVAPTVFDLGASYGMALTLGAIFTGFALV